MGSTNSSVALKKYISVLNMIMLLTGFFSSCQKEHNSNNPITIEGAFKLEVHAMHHSWDVSFIHIYLEKNATEFPGTDSTIYDLHGQADGYGKFTFEKLHPGEYYVYACGYDATWGSNVVGSKKITLNSTTVENNEAKLTLYVSE